MNKEDWGNLAAFEVIAAEQSFSRAAVRLGVSASALSHSMRLLEERLQVRLLARTTRRVSTTDAGERLLKRLGPAFGEVRDALMELEGLAEQPAGRLRITSPRLPARRILGPMLPAFTTAYPKVTVEVSIEAGFTDIVAHRFDAGIRLGESLAQDMVSVRISKDQRAAVVGSPSYFQDRPAPATPHELSSHQCIGFRFIGSGAVYKWEFKNAAGAVEFLPGGPLVFNDEDLMVQAALRGAGLAYVFEEEVADLVAARQLVRVLEDWCPPFPGFFLYYAGRRQLPAPLGALISALRASLPP